MFKQINKKIIAILYPKYLLIWMYVYFRGFCLTVNGEKGEMKGKNIQLKILKLPHEIDSDKSYHEVIN